MFREPCEAIRDPLWGHIYIPSKLFDAVKTSDFIRLTRIRQLGPTFYTYPGATHTRAAHSFGVYHIAMRILNKLLKEGADEWTTTVGRKSFAAAALFHDLGHFPYTHSLKELSLIEHETLTAHQVLREPLASIIHNFGGSAEQTAAIVCDEIPTIDTETLFFRGLLSGVLDPDKLDYLNRDAFFCGVPYGKQDIDYILTIIHPNKEKGICVNSSGISSVEDILFSKYLMYKSVYWHKQVRMATAMMKKTLKAALEKNIIEAEELYELDDENLFYLLDKRSTKSFDEYVCAKELREQKLYKTIVELSFDENNLKHINLENLTNRSLLEDNIATTLGYPSSDILIDIPERISFESDLYIKDIDVSFSKSPTVFSINTVRSFVSSLRNIRVGVRQQNQPISQKTLEKIIALF